MSDEHCELHVELNAESTINLYHGSTRTQDRAMLTMILVTTYQPKYYSTSMICNWYPVHLKAVDTIGNYSK